MSTGTPITDPVKLAWRAFARRYATYREIPPGELGLSIASFEAGAKWQAARVRGELLAWAEEFMRRGAYLDSFLTALDRICPEEG